MIIYNEQKTKQLDSKDLDLVLGHLVADKLFIKHHEAIPSSPAKSAAQVAEELRAQGKQVEEIRGKYYQIVKVYPNGGRQVKEVAPQAQVIAKEAYDEYQNILVYKPYTAVELLENRKEQLRGWREQYFAIIDRAVWYDSLTQQERSEVKQFRQQLKDITLTLEKPSIPACVQAEIKD